MVVHKLNDIEKIKDKKVYDYFKIFNGNHSPIDNLKADFFFIEINDKTIPCTLNNEEYDNTYINSMYTAFVLYAKEELKKTNNPILIYSLTLFISLFGYLLKSIKVNKIIQINNWLLSTNIVVELNEAEIKNITEYLQHKYPDHVYIMRSITKELNPSTYQNFLNNKYNLLPTRKVYLYKKEDELKNNNIKNDIRLRNKTDLKLEYITSVNQLSENDLNRIIDLYNKLYIEKYSQYNPKYNIHFLKNIIDNQFIELYCYRNNGEIDAVGGIFQNEQLQTLPIVGYDTDKPAKLGLYRLIIIEILLKVKNKTLNLSSGAGKFKAFRGGIPEHEYAALYTKHLSFYKRTIWKLLVKSLQVGLKIADKYEL